MAEENRRMFMFKWSVAFDHPEANDSESEAQIITRIQISLVDTQAITTDWCPSWLNEIKVMKKNKLKTTSVPPLSRNFAVLSLILWVLLY